MVKILITYKNKLHEIFNELDVLCRDYENQIIHLKKDIDNLTKRNIELTELYQKNDNIANQLISSFLRHLIKNNYSTQIQQLLDNFVGDEYESSNIQILLVKNLIDLKEYELAISCIHHLFFRVDSKQCTRLLINILDLLMEEKYDVLELSDKRYLTVLHTIQGFVFTKNHDTFSEYLKEFHDKYNDLILGSNEPKIILEYLSCVLNYSNKEMLLKIIKDVVFEWPFLDANVSKTEFTKFLFFSFLVDMDSNLIDQAKKCNKFLLSNEPEIMMYQTYYDIVNNNIIPIVGMKKLEEFKKKQTIFNKDDIKLIINKMNQNLEMLTSSICNEDFKLANKQVTKDIHFKWPSTEITITESIRKDTELKNKSDLKKLGYQITGLSRQRRWEILSTKAVPKLGLKKVAYTIAFLVRGRKSMKNGTVKNQHSISEWEYDLLKLKKNFYKKDFKWPHT